MRGTLKLLKSLEAHNYFLLATHFSEANKTGTVGASDLSSKITFYAV